MNIYELLKAGESIESIRMAFGKELAEASDKLRKEQETERLVHDLAVAREDLVDSIVTYSEIYLETLFGEFYQFSDTETEAIRQELIDQEKELKTYFKDKKASHLTPDETRDELMKLVKEYVLTDPSVKEVKLPF